MNNEIDYKNSLKWINSFQKFGIKLDLGRIKYILNELDNPQNNYKIIHIGGSNGKGSVSNFISSILIESGFIVGTNIEKENFRFFIYSYSNLNASIGFS